MNEEKFQRLIDELLIDLEDRIEELDVRIECEIESGILTIICPDKTHIVITRQVAMHQLWLAAKNGGYHFNYNEDLKQWTCSKSGELFIFILNRSLSEQCHQNIEL